MQDKQDEEHFIPVVICRKCGVETPLTHRAHLTKEGHEDIDLWSTPCCDILPIEESEIKGYVSIADLKAMGYEEIKG